MLPLLTVYSTVACFLECCIQQLGRHLTLARKKSFAFQHSQAIPSKLVLILSQLLADAPRAPSLFPDEFQDLVADHGQSFPNDNMNIQVVVGGLLRCFRVAEADIEAWKLMEGSESCSVFLHVFSLFFGR